MNTTITYGMAFAEYCAHPGVNASLLKHGRHSMKRLRHAIDNPTKDTPALVFGRAVHAALFEASTFQARYAIWEGGRRQGKEWEAFEAQHADREILPIDAAEKAAAAGVAAVNHKLVAQLLREGKPEVSLFWESNGLQCKGRVDWLATNNGEPVAIVDLKTAANINHREFGLQFEKLGYHVSLGFYRMGLRTIIGRNLPVYVVALESEPPHDVVRILVPEPVLEVGEELATSLLQRVKHCKALGQWPGICEEEDYGLSFPEYAMPQEDLVITIDGEEVRL